MIVATEFPFELTEFAREPKVLAQIHSGFIAEPTRSVLVSMLIAPVDAARMRAVIDAHATPFLIPDRGCYHHTEIALDAVAPLHALAEAIVGRKLAVHHARALRFGHGGYQLTRDDKYDQIKLGLTTQSSYELDLDLSDEITGEGETVFADATTAPVLTVPHMPGTAVLLERLPNALYRWVKYLPYRIGERRVYRLRVVFRAA